MGATSLLLTKIKNRSWDKEVVLGDTPLPNHLPNMATHVFGDNDLRKIILEFKTKCVTNEMLAAHKAQFAETVFLLDDVGSVYRSTALDVWPVYNPDIPFSEWLFRYYGWPFRLREPCGRRI